MFRARNYEKAARSVCGWGGVGTSQRGWLTPDDVTNTWPPDKLRAFLRKAR